MNARLATLGGIAGVMMAVAMTVASSAAQQRVPSAPAGGVSVVVTDLEISAMLKEVSAARIQQTIEKLVSFHTRHTLSADMPAAGGKGIAAAAEWIRSEFDRYSKECGNCLEIKTDEFIQPAGPRVAKPTKITNVYAVLRGANTANAGRIFVVSGHYDSRNSDALDATGAAPGANDDGSGTAVSLECARVLSKHRFPATIIFLTVAGEEQGLDGSAHFAQMAKAAGWDIEGVLNNDIVGGDRTPEVPGQDIRQNSHVVRVFSEGVSSSAGQEELRRMRSIGGENDGPSRQLARYIAEVGEQYWSSNPPPGGLPTSVARPELVGKDIHAMMVFRQDRFGRGGDHISFNERGYPAVRFTEFLENYEHQHMNVMKDKSGEMFGDLPPYVDYEYTANVARLNAATLASLASAPAPPQHVRIVMEAPDDPALQWQRNRAILKWDPSPGGLAIRYELVWRDTTAPDWQHMLSVGNATEETSWEFKDNVVFGIRAVDLKGHRSLPVVPVPER